ncbi:DUF3365 domain-containing protein [Draconibacterium sp. IB214405]|uniref:Tll0287-like domain-containing protein n=1 Tax=Draconibacterium sp. IB214405 TaxID=3097352 RepID=UPI002A166368|nr:DUF3365 domain-containing protein [Draconibacterium sp. IB214405]MDX8337565.1 DUF3365 domain-containing protein [Draconibacterium sp. IB214405]
MTNKILPILLLFFCFACSPKLDNDTYKKFKNSGQEITANVQAVLLSNVGKAIQTGGPEYAVEFCNLEAASIVDSLNGVFDCNISRVSAKNRNPQNALSTEQEKEMWKLFTEQQLADTLLQSGSNLVYYKPIKIGMPACLKCHGNPETDINPATGAKLQELYPADLATGYQLNDFRGLWKVEFTKAK